MSKDWTEQWRNGTLPEGWYYVKTPGGEIKKLYCEYGEAFELEDSETAGYYFFHRDLNKGQVEVLAPVPDYMDCKRLMNDSIELDKGKIKIYELVSHSDELVQKIHILNEANMKLENTVGKLCEQVNEANKIIKKLYKESGNPIGCDYLERYGVE